MRFNIASPAMQEPAMTIQEPAIVGINMPNYSMDMPELEQMRTFPTSVPLPDLDGDLEFLDFFDPFLGMEPKLMGNFAIPPVRRNSDSWSPLEHFSSSSQTSMQDYGFLQPLQPLRPLAAAGQVPAGFTTVNSHEAPFAPLPLPGDDPFNADVSPPLNAFPATSPALVLPPPDELEKQPTPKLARTPFTKPPAPVFTDQMRTNLLNDLGERLTAAELARFRLPSAPALQKCIRTAIDNFHVHMPILHLQTLDFATAPSPLILVICAIGALYRLERKIAEQLYRKADEALAATLKRTKDQDSQPSISEDWVPPPSQETKADPQLLWRSQARLLIKMFATFCGVVQIVSESLCHLGDFLVVSYSVVGSKSQLADSIQGLPPAGPNGESRQGQPGKPYLGGMGAQGEHQKVSFIGPATVCCAELTSLQQASVRTHPLWQSRHHDLRYRTGLFCRVGRLHRDAM